MLSFKTEAPRYLQPQISLSWIRYQFLYFNICLIRPQDSTTMTLRGTKIKRKPCKLHSISGFFFQLHVLPWESSSWGIIRSSMIHTIRVVSQSFFFFINVYKVYTSYSINWIILTRWRGFTQFYFTSQNMLTCKKKI